MLVDELRELTNNSKQYQEEYEGIVKKLREIALCGLNEMKVIGEKHVYSYHRELIVYLLNQIKIEVSILLE